MATKKADIGVAAHDAELTLYLVRHGETLFNTTEQTQGFCDSPLTNLGIQQAILLGKRLGNIRFTAAYSSDLGRQRHTARLILEQNVHSIPVLEELYGLREWNYGGYEGRPNAEMMTPILKKAGIRRDENNNHGMKAYQILGERGIAEVLAENDPLGLVEEYDNILSRGQAVMDTIIKNSMKLGEGNVLIVSSGAMILSLLVMLFPTSIHYDQIIDNCSVTTMTYKDGKYTLKKFGDSSYLK